MIRECQEYTREYPQHKSPHSEILRQNQPITPIPCPPLVEMVLTRGKRDFVIFWRNKYFNKGEEDKELMSSYSLECSKNSFQMSNAHWLPDQYHYYYYCGHPPRDINKNYWLIELIQLYGGRYFGVKRIIITQPVKTIGNIEFFDLRQIGKRKEKQRPDHWSTDLCACNVNTK